MQSFMKLRTQFTDLSDSWLLCDWSRVCTLPTNVTTLYGRGQSGTELPEEQLQPLHRVEEVRRGQPGQGYSAGEGDSRPATVA